MQYPRGTPRGLGKIPWLAGMTSAQKDALRKTASGAACLRGPTSHILCLHAAPLKGVMAWGRMSGPGGLTLVPDWEGAVLGCLTIRRIFDCRCSSSVKSMRTDVLACSTLRRRHVVCGRFCARPRFHHNDKLQCDSQQCPIWWRVLCCSRSHYAGKNHVLIILRFSNHSDQVQRSSASRFAFHLRQPRMPNTSGAFMLHPEP